MSINAESYRKAAYPPPLRSPEHLSDEDVAYLLNKSHRKRKPARPATSTLASAEASPSSPAKATN
jgi:hypothetical protein